MHQNGHS